MPRYKNMFTGQTVTAVLYTENRDEVAKALGFDVDLETPTTSEYAGLFKTPWGHFIVDPEHWVYVDPDKTGVWKLRPGTFEKIWIPEDEDPKNHLDFYVQKGNGVLRAAVQFDGTNALVIVHMFKEVLDFRHMPEDEVLYIKEKRDGKEVEHHIHYGGWVISSMYGDWYYPIHGADFYDRYVKLNDNFGKKEV